MEYKEKNISNIKIKKLYYFILLFAGMLLSGIQFSAWNKLRTYNYSPPSFEELEISTGLLYFTDVWRSTGGSIILIPEQSKKIQLSCSGPFSSNPCYLIDENGKWVDHKSELIGKSVTAWWYPGNADETHGRIYQLKKGDKLIYTYDQKVNEYVKAYRRGPPNHLAYAICLFLLFVPYSVYKITIDE